MLPQCINHDYLCRPETDPDLAVLVSCEVMTPSAGHRTLLSTNLFKTKEILKTITQSTHLPFLLYDLPFHCCREEGPASSSLCGKIRLYVKWFLPPVSANFIRIFSSQPNAPAAALRTGAIIPLIVTSWVWSHIADTGEPLNCLLLLHQPAPYYVGSIHLYREVL